MRVYDEYGDPDEDAKYLYYVLVYDILEKIGRPAASGLRELAESPDGDISKPAKEALSKLKERGLLDDGDAGQDGCGDSDDSV